jgi:selenocysteine-specific elongation factor
MDVLMLVIAANEGVMPQTIEHLQILRYLNVRKALVVLTKIDLIPAEQRDDVRRDVQAQLEGTLAEGASIVAISTVTGENIDALKTHLKEQLASLEPHDADAPVYMPVDRVFSLPGRGTIVTGTLMQGRIGVGDTLSLEPKGVPARVRSVHVFGQARDRVFGGTRVAINVPGIETHDIARGDVVTDPQFHARSTFDVLFTPLPDAVGIVRRRTPVRAHIGSAEILGTLVLPSAPENGEAERGQLFLKAPVLAFPGVRFVLRRVSPKTLLGGGQIVGMDSLVQPDDAHDAATNSILELLRQRGPEPVQIGELAFAANLREEAVGRAVSALLESGDAIKILRPESYLSSDVAGELCERAVAALQAAQEREPWSMGVTSLTLSRILQMQEPLLIRLLTAFVDDGRLAQRSGYYSTTDHAPKLTAEQRAFFDHAVPLDPESPFVPVEFATVASAAKSSDDKGLPRALETLLVRGVFVRVGEALYRGSQIQQIHEKVETFIDEHERMSMAEFRDLLGTSRKYAVPLLEWFDSRGITVRSGDYRMLRTRKAANGASS